MSNRTARAFRYLMTCAAGGFLFQAASCTPVLQEAFTSLTTTAVTSVVSDAVFNLFGLTGGP